jgi:ribonuclease HI
VIGKGSSWTSQIKRLTRPTWGLTPNHARKLYTSVAIPRILYAADVWCTPARKDGQEKKGVTKVIKRLTTVQRTGALAITGGLSTSPTDALDANAYLLPAPLTVDKWRHRAAVRMAMLPKDHPLHKITGRKNTGKIRKHKSPINDLLGAYGYDYKNFEKIPATTRDPSAIGKPPFTISIAEDKASSTAEAENATEEIQVFSDGSAINGKVGAAAILTRAGNPIRTMHFHLGTENEHTVHEAELVGILLGIHLISTERHGSTTCAIGVDNQAAIKAFQSSLRKPGHHLAREIERIAKKVQKRRSKARYSMIIRWTAGHEGIVGNEAADEEAKRAADGLTTDKPMLPSYLRKCLPINPAAVKRAYHDKLKKKWTEDWRNSARGRKTAKLDESTPSKKLLKGISDQKLSRVAASCIAQFRLGHAPVNQYLKRIGRVDNARCPACGDDEETPEHFLLQCPSYAHERWALAQNVKKKRQNMSMKTLLGNPELVLPVANYIEATNRFKTPETKES